MQKQMEKMQQPVESSKISTEHNHEHLTADNVLKFYAENKECPGGVCPGEEKKLETHYVKKFRDSRKELPFVCDRCGLGVEEKESEKEDWECPTCGNQYARQRD